MREIAFLVGAPSARPDVERTCPTPGTARARTRTVESLYRSRCAMQSINCVGRHTARRASFGSATRIEDLRCSNPLHARFELGETYCLMQRNVASNICVMPQNAPSRQIICNDGQLIMSSRWARPLTCQQYWIPVMPRAVMLRIRRWSVGPCAFEIIAALHRASPGQLIPR